LSVDFLIASKIFTIFELKKSLTYRFIDILFNKETQFLHIHLHTKMLILGKGFQILLPHTNKIESSRRFAS